MFRIAMGAQKYLLGINLLGGKSNRIEKVDDVKVQFMDGKVRRAMISYKTEEGTRSVVERAVQKLIVLVPKED